MSTDNKTFLVTTLIDNLETFDRDVNITEGYNFNMPDVINRIELYRASKFESGEFD